MDGTGGPTKAKDRTYTAAIKLALNVNRCRTIFVQFIPLWYFISRTDRRLSVSNNYLYWSGQYMDVLTGPIDVERLKAARVWVFKM
jgi:hypothetical protein